MRTSLCYNWLMVEELGGQYTAAGRSHGGFSIELLILYCLGKQLTSKQASRRDFEANKQASKQRASKLGNQASRGVFCLLACLSASLVKINLAAYVLNSLLQRAVVVQGEAGTRARSNLCIGRGAFRHSKIKKSIHSEVTLPLNNINIYYYYWSYTDLALRPCGTPSTFINIYYNQPFGFSLWNKAYLIENLLFIHFIALIILCCMALYYYYLTH